MADGIDRDDATSERPAPEVEPTTTDAPAAERAEAPADVHPGTEDDVHPAEAEPVAEGDAPDADDAAEPETQASGDQAGEPDGDEPAGPTVDEPGDGAEEATVDEPGDGAEEATVDEPGDDVAEAAADEPSDDLAGATAEDSGDDAAEPTADEPGDEAADATADEPGDDTADATAAGEATESDEPASARDESAETDEPVADPAEIDGDIVDSTDSGEPGESDDAVAASSQSDDPVAEPEDSSEPPAPEVTAAEGGASHEPTAGSPEADAEPRTPPVDETADDAGADEPRDDAGADEEPDGLPSGTGAATVVMPPVDDAPPVVSPPRSSEPAAPAVPATPTGPRTEVLTPYGSIAAQAPDKAPGATPVRTSAFGGRDAAAAPAAGLGAAATSTAAAASSAAPATASAASQTQPALAAATATLPPTSTGPAQPAARAFEHVPQTERPSSPLDVFEPQRHERRWPRRVGIAAGVLVVLGGAYVGASYALGDKVPRGATVAGVEIGGLSSAQAVAALDAQLDGATGKAIPVTVHGTASSLDPAKAGLTFDADATVGRLTGVDLSAPIRLWDHLVGVGDQPAVAAVDEAKLTSAIQALGKSTGKKAVDGSIVFVDGSAHETAAKEGWALDEDAARDVVRASWLSGARPLDLPSKTVTPTITSDETDRAMSEIAEPLTGAPVSVQVDGRLAVLQPLQLAAAATIAPKDGSLQLTMDGAKLRADVLTQVPDLLTKPADATFAFKDDKPVLVPGKAGTELDPATLATAVAGAAVADNRTVAVSLTPTQPEDSTDALQKLGIKEVVSEFSTPLTAEKIRDINIKQGAKNITGTLIKPGETFSLGKALGQVDAAHGFVDAGAIVDGEHTDAMGGGLSQLSTTTYNAAYFAGFQILEHHPHSEWFARYPEGRESTLFLPSMDMRWKNNTPTGALVQAWVANNRTYVRIWGTKYWTVQSTTGPRSGVVQPTTRYSQSKTCEPAAAGNPGFTVTVTRRTYLGGQLKDTSSYTTRYKPQDKVVCGKAPASTTSSAG